MSLMETDTQFRTQDVGEAHVRIIRNNNLAPFRSNYSPQSYSSAYCF